MVWTTLRLRVIGAVALVATLAVVLALIPWRVTSTSLRAEAERRLRVALDAPEATFGKMTLTLLPIPKLRISDVVFEQKSGRFAGEIATLKADLRIPALLRGVAKPNGIEMVRPHLTLRMPEYGGDPVANLQGSVALATSYLAAHGSLSGLAEISVSKGSISVRSPHDTRVLQDVRLNASLPSRNRPLKVSGTLTLDHEPVRVSFSGATPEMLRSGATETIAASAESSLWALEFNGSGSLSRGIALRGQLTARHVKDLETPFRPALQLLGLDPNAATVIRAVLDSGPRGTALTDLVVTSGQHRFEGVGAVRREDARWQVNATLATARADITPLMQLSSQVYHPDLGWNTSRLALEPLFAFNSDLRLSVDTLKIGPAAMTQAAIALITRGNRVEVALGDSVLEGGRARGRLIINRSLDDYEVRGNVLLDSVNAGALNAKLPVPQRISGIASANVTFESQGASVAQLVAQLDGKMQMSFRAGEITGIDLARLAMRRNAQRNLALAESLGGKTSFESATLTTRIMRGLVAPVEGTMHAQYLVGNLGGDIDLAGASINLIGAVVQIQPEPGQSEPKPVIDFTVTGPLLDPRVTPNTAVLLRRS